MTFLPLLILSVLSISTPPRVYAEHCPGAEPGHLEYVRLFFASEATQSFREQHGLLEISPDDIRLLTDERDAEVCRRMTQTVRLDQTGPYPKVWRGFKAGDFYLMLVTRELPPGVFYHGGGTGLVVLNAEMEIIGAAS